MKYLSGFCIACVVLQAVCYVALYIEIFVNDIGSMTAVYVWAGLAVAGLVGNAVGTVLKWTRG